MIFRLWTSRKNRENEARVHAIYAAIVAQARQPVFYAELGVPDTLEGRFEMLLVHAYLYMRRLKDEPAAEETARQVIETMFQDMDHSLREMGVGDLSVGKKMKKMAQAFYGRAEAYDAGIAEGDALADAVLRNVLGGEGRAADAAAIASYMRKADAALAAQGIEVLTAKGPVFPVPEGDAR
jgi:cytochrome b pre-mRNA-processing protein 3